MLLTLDIPSGLKFADARRRWNTSAIVSMNSFYPAQAANFRVVGKFFVHATADVSHRL